MWRHPIFRGAVERFALLGVEFAGDIDNVVALIDALWQGIVATAVLHVAPIDRQGEDIHLPPGVVDVVFVVHLMSVGTQDVGQRRAVSSTASVADVQWSGRVSRDEFQQDFLRVFRLMTAEVFAFLNDAG